MNALPYFFAALILITSGCSGSGTSSPGAAPSPGTEGYFTVIPTTEEDSPCVDRKVEVFGIPIYAVPGVDDKRLLHAANIMAQYLDNDEDGAVDNELVVDEMRQANAFLIMWKNESDFFTCTPPDDAEGQDLGNDETIPEWHTNGHTGQFDASLEEIWHLITHTGYANAYPNIFGEGAGSALADAMDIARGGQHLAIPDTYPEAAWYTYDDDTCEYDCMITEYFYWAMTSLLGAQENRLSEIEEEWDLNTRSLLQATDRAVYDLLTDPQYALPTILPDGSYR